jgi:hypothetical protein
LIVFAVGNVDQLNAGRGAGFRQMLRMGARAEDGGATRKSQAEKGVSKISQGSLPIFLPVRAASRPYLM